MGCLDSGESAERQVPSDHKNPSKLYMGLENHFKALG